MTRKALVREVNPHLICVLCSGYLIEATTIVECLHSFCRSCLIKYLEKNKFCPICDVQLHKNNPLLSVRCDPILQQLVYKLIPGLYAKEMGRRRKYYSELGGGPSSDSDNVEYPIPDSYFSPTDCISLSLEFISSAHGATDDSSNDAEDSVERQGVHHRRYLQCPAAVNMSHLKKFLRMKYDLTPEYDVEILYAGEVLTDEFSLMDVAYTFSWNKATPMRFQFRLVQKHRVPKVKHYLQKAECVKKSALNGPSELVPEENNVLKVAEEAEANVGSRKSGAKVIEEEADEEDEDVVDKIEEEVHNIEEDEDSNQALDNEDVNDKLEEDDEEQRLEEEETLERLEDDDAIERMEEDEENQRLDEEAMMEEEAIEEVGEDEIEEVHEIVPPPKEEKPKEPIRPNGLKRPHNIEIPHQEVERKKPKLSPPRKIDLMQYKQDEKRFLEDMIVEEDTDEDRLRISASEEEKSPTQSEVEKKIRSEERRKKKNKKNRHHHHHRHHHHDWERCESPPSAQIVHSPENDILKLKVKLTAIKTGDNTVKGYTVSEGTDTRKEYKESKENGYKHSEKAEKPEKNKVREEQHKTPSPVTYSSAAAVNNNNTINCNNNINSQQNSVSNNTNSNNNTNGNNNKNISPTQFSSAALAEFARRTEEMNKEKLQQQQQEQLKALRKVVPKINGSVKTEPMKMPPSSITVSKITAEEKRQMEQQKLLMNRNQSNGMDPKRPSLEIMLVNAPKKGEVGNKSPSPPKPESPKKVMRPIPQSIPLSKLGKAGLKGSPPPLRAVRPPEEALDLSGKSSRKSPVPDSLRIPLVKPAYVASPARPCKPNPTVRQIPNPSALLYRSQAAMNGRPLPPPAVPISSLRQIETMTKKIEKVAAGLSVKAAAAGGYGAK